MNVVALIGHLTRPAEQRVLPSGYRLVGLQVSVARENERTESVPVVWFDAPASAAELDVNDEVVVVGRVRRRFFQAGGATQSRTEVVADAVIPARHKKRALALVTDALTVADEVAAQELAARSGRADR
ncbi:MAG TPA: single-stranded DNA-binding protein [Acidimicrobiales bacterium]|nr:single-stranded DNA-binding protein [Acidimicrobiales bacterium]